MAVHESLHHVLDRSRYMSPRYDFGKATDRYVLGSNLKITDRPSKIGRDRYITFGNLSDGANGGLQKGAHRARRGRFVRRTPSNPPGVPIRLTA